jgi:hypothetical protein
MCGDRPVADQERWLTRVAWVGAGLAVAALWWTAPAIGFVRDEGYYFKAARLYVGWFGEWASGAAFTDDVIRRYFDYNHEHPPLVKLVQGGLHALLHEGMGVAPSQALRSAGFLSAGAMLLATFYLGRAAYGAPAGLLGMGLVASLPRPFFDAHLACFDIPIAALWTWSVHTFLLAWRETTARGRLGPWAWVAGAVFGLGLASKLNALFLPVVFVAIWLADPPTSLWPWSRAGPGGTREWVLPGLPRLLLRTAWVGGLVFLATWPYLWPAPLARTGEYLRFHLQHEHYPISYFHQLWVAPPFPVSFPWVMTALTVPGPVLVLGAVGLAWTAGEAWRRDPRAVALLVSALLPIVLISLPGTPIFGGTKHWYNALPALCVMAGRVGALGLARLAGGKAWASALGALLLMGPGVAGIVRTHPFGIAYYNEWAGGVRGAAELGMQRAFWGTVARPLLDDLPPGQRVFFHRTNYDSYRMYREERVLPSGTTWSNEVEPASVAWYFEQPEHAETQSEIWTHLGTRPVAGVYLDNVCLAQMYVRGRSRAPPDREGGAASPTPGP